jgi:hypothetical protein
MIERNGRKFYVVVVQAYDDDINHICPMSVLGFGYMVSGFPYWFDKEEDRDKAIDIFKKTKLNYLEVKKNQKN